MSWLSSGRSRQVAMLALRIALATAFLSAVADRSGVWGPAGTTNVFWGSFGAFVAYTATLMPFVSAGLVPVLAWISTAAEVILAIGLLVGWQLRWFALGSALLLAVFGVAMALFAGFESTFSYNVWTTMAASYALAYLAAERIAKSTTTA